MLDASRAICKTKTMATASPPTRAELESLLRFYAESGLDFPISDEPFDHLEPNAAAQAGPAASGRGEAPVQQAAAPGQSPVMPDADAVALARKASEGASSLDELRAAVEAFTACNLKLTARNTVFEGGTRGAAIMVISDAPGRDDDASGDALTGPEGRLFDRMLAAIGLSRDDCYIGFAVPWRIPGDGPATPLNAAICKPFAERQIELAAPSLVVLLGNGAARMFLGDTGNILQLRGSWQELKTTGGYEVAAMPTLQPRYLLEQPAQKRYAWNDLQAIASRLKGADKSP
ncbi:uracil-DNA glycosylase [Oricola sp.]|uniref:uracil-DNA glycosylase n=1 Tax=Oricola sp. TaxID=1979950 RepID=UPI003BAD6105